MNNLNESIKNILLHEAQSLTLKGDIDKTRQQIGFLRKEIEKSDAKSKRLLLSTLKALEDYFEDVAETATKLNK